MRRTSESRRSSTPGTILTKRCTHTTELIELTRRVPLDERAQYQRFESSQVSYAKPLRPKWRQYWLRAMQGDFKRDQPPQNQRQCHAAVSDGDVQIL